jgi:succinoglycan biosynthesis protein ExoM
MGHAHAPLGRAVEQSLFRGYQALNAGGDKSHQRDNASPSAGRGHMTSTTEGISVAMCACTCRRPAGLTALLEALARQRFVRRTPPRLSVVIVDNEGSEQAKSLCDRFRCTDIPIRYVHEPRRGISYARNRCLDAVDAECDFIAMIDDDEIPDPDWIEQLLEAQEASGADVVEGRVVPVFPEGAPDWIVRGRYFGWHHNLNKAHRPGQQVYPELNEARTNNVLIKCAVVRELGLRFDPRLTLTGGEDIVFFQAIVSAGYRIVYAADASAREMIPLERTTLRYLWRQWYRVGSNARLKRAIRRKQNATLKRRFMWKWHSSGFASLCKGLAVMTRALLRGRIGLDHLAPGIKQFAYGLGQVASAIGIRYEQYRHGAVDCGARSHVERVADR